MSNAKRRGVDGTLQAADIDPAPPRLSHPVVLFRLLKLSNLLTRPFFAHFSDRYDLSLNDLRVLMTLATMRQAAAHEIGEAVGIHPMNVSRSVATLRRQGRLEERQDPLNRRRKILSLTEEGRALHSKLIPHVRKISEFAFSSMSQLEEESFGKLLEVLAAKLETVDPSSPLLIDSDILDGDPPVRARRPRSHKAD